MISIFIWEQPISKKLASNSILATVISSMQFMGTFIDSNKEFNTKLTILIRPRSFFAWSPQVKKPKTIYLISVSKLLSTIDINGQII